MLKTFSLARMSPYTTSNNSRRYHRPHPPFTRMAIMYLWGQYSYLRSYCLLIASHVRVSIWDARSAHLYTESKTIKLSCDKISPQLVGSEKRSFLHFWKSPISGGQRVWQKDNLSFKNTFLHLTTDRFSLKSGVYTLTKFFLLLFVADFFREFCARNYKSL